MPTGTMCPRDHRKSDGVSSVTPHGRTKVGPAPHEERSLTAAGSNGPPGIFSGLTQPRPHPHISVHESHPENRRSSVGSYELGLLPRRVRSSVVRVRHKKTLRARTSAQQSPVRNANWRVFGACSCRRDPHLVPIFSVSWAFMDQMGLPQDIGRVSSTKISAAQNAPVF